MRLLPRSATVFAFAATLAAAGCSSSEGPLATEATKSGTPDVPMMAHRGNQGCTPGFWKNHRDAWRRVSPDQTAESVFSAIAGVSSDLAGRTLIQSLAGGGGPGLEGAAKILMRAAVAALLNSFDATGVLYPLQPDEVIAQVNAALASGSRSEILSLASELDRLNNLGCPL